MIVHGMAKLHKRWEERINRRKFRSEISDNMDSWKSTNRKNQRGEEKNENIKEEIRCKCTKRQENRDALCFSNDLWLKRVEK